MVPSVIRLLASRKSISRPMNGWILLHRVEWNGPFVGAGQVKAVGSGDAENLIETGFAPDFGADALREDFGGIPDILESDV